jgi:hypothetical protein
MGDVVFVGSRVTWFLGSGNQWRWTDPTGHVWYDDSAERNGEGPYASGRPYNTPGIALPNNHATLRGWFRVVMPRINIVMVVPHIDIAPKGDVDLSAPLAFMVFTEPGKVDNTAWSAEFVGHAVPDGMSPNIVNTRTGVVTPIPETL